MNLLTGLLLLFTILGVFAFIGKTGFPWFYAFFFFIPIGNICFFLYLCYSTWPIEEELKRYKIRLGDISDDGVNDLLDESVCLACGTKILPKTEFCSNCGWSYK